MQEYRFTVTVLVGLVSERSSQNKIDAYCSSTGSSSIKLAVESDKTLNGKAFDTRVSEMRTYSSVTVGDVKYLGAEFIVLCYAD
jgi:predicted ATP-grasp superfamily ATP-dependent carboligase